jgi:hypothetical protein
MGVEHRLAFGIIPNLDRLAAFILTGRPQAGAFARLGINSVIFPPSANAMAG